MTVSDSATSVLKLGSWRSGALSQAGTLRLLGRKPLGAFSMAIIAAVIITSVFAPLLAPYDPNASVGPRLAGPSATFLLGTDDIGRDIVSRLIYGAHISLEVGIVSVAIGVTIGTAIGIMSALFGGQFVDTVLQRLVDVLMAFPPILMALAIIAALGVGLQNEIFAISVAIIPFTARVVRSSGLIIKGSLYVEAARAVGAGHWRIMMRYILPNVMAPVIVIVSTSIGGAILAEAGLSFLGLGTPPPTASWGQMVNEATQGYLNSQPWLTVAPGLCIGVVVLAFNLLGDALRDVLDPRLRRG